MALPTRRARRTAAPAEVPAPPLAEGKTRRTSVKKTPVTAAPRKKRATPPPPPIISPDKGAAPASSPKSTRRPRAPKTIPPLIKPMT